MRAKDAVGRYGERVAVRHLLDLGYQVLDRNWRCSLGELDVVAVDDDCLVAVEVKTRRSLAAGHPLEAVTPAKLARLRRLLGVWLAEHADDPVRGRRWPQVRIDVVAVLRPARGAAVVDHVQAVG
ncbi:YraN family protein [Quadrisphaera sp. GCM10027208]|uniref:YraN family protein n=1 Tax=Quadrisphaera sp. GCM10027208 TaxID=3273423 RepID=UPI0036167768|nr:YraN family protein [Kineosporiaceae bacterium SCSIO 59966]